jgi:hypothetical protein
LFKNHLASVPATLSISLALLLAAACSGQIAEEGVDEGSKTEGDGDPGAVDSLARKPKPVADGGTGGGGAGSCTAATASVDCDDRNACTTDSCISNRCKHSPVSSCAPAGLPVDLKTAGAYVVLAKSAISTVPSSAISGNLGLSPAAASNMTGFSLVLDATGTFSRSTQVSGMLFGADYAVPTPSNLTTAIGDTETAFTDAAGRAPDFTEVGAGNIGGLTLPAGVYKWGTGVIIPTDVTLTGSATDVWIFQVAGTLVMSGSKKVTLAGAALPKNVFWQVSGLVDIGSAAQFSGVVLTKTAVTVKTGALVNGRLLAQTAVSLQKATITQPAP